MRQPLALTGRLGLTVETEIMSVETVPPIDVGDAMKRSKRVPRWTALTLPSGTAIAEWPSSAVASGATVSREPAAASIDYRGARAGHAVGSVQTVDGQLPTKSDVQIPTSPSVAVARSARPADRGSQTTSTLTASATWRSPVAAGRYFTGVPSGEHPLTLTKRTSKTQGHGSGGTVTAAFAPSNGFRTEQNIPTGSSLAAVNPTETDNVAGASGVAAKNPLPPSMRRSSSLNHNPSRPDRRPLY